MRLSTRQMVGVGLSGLSLLTGILLQALTGSVVDVRTVHEDRLPNSAVALDIAVVGLHWKTAIPLGAVFAVGLVSLAWPTRRLSP